MLGSVPLSCRLRLHCLLVYWIYLMVVSWLSCLPVKAGIMRGSSLVVSLFRRLRIHHDFHHSTICVRIFRQTSSHSLLLSWATRLNVELMTWCSIRASTTTVCWLSCCRTAACSCGRSQTKWWNGWHDSRPPSVSLAVSAVHVCVRMCCSCVVVKCFLCSHFRSVNVCSLHHLFLSVQCAVYDYVIVFIPYWIK